MHHPLFHAGIVLLLYLPIIALSIEPAQEEQTVVTAARVALPSSSVGATVTIITAADIERRGAFFVSDILKGIPGLAVSGSGTPATLTQVRIRGAEADHTQVFIDGVEMNDPASFSQFNFGLLTRENIERIEIIRGAQSALSGSGAIGGVINIITKRGEGPLSISAGLAGGAFKTRIGSIGVAYQNELFDYNIHAAKLRANGNNIARTGIEKDGYENSTYDIKLGLRPAEFVEFRISGRHIDSETETDPQPGPVVIDNTENKTLNKRDYLNGVARLSFFKDRWQHRLSIKSTKTDNRYRPSGYTNEGRRRKYTYQSDLHLVASDIGMLQHFSFLIERQDRTTTATDRKIDSWSYAAEYHIGLFKRLSITAGIRHDDNTFFKDATTYRINTSYSWHEFGTRLYAHYGTGNKNPTISELFGTSADFVSNPSLKPEQSTSWDIGIEQSLLDKYLSLNITYYKNRITNRIASSRTQSGQNTVINQEGTSPIYGIETTIDMRINENIGLLAGYSYTHARDADGLALVRRPQHSASLRLDYTSVNNKTNINLGVYHNGNRKDYVYNIGRIALPSFTLVNLNVYYQATKRVQLYGNIENLFDKQYEEIYSYQALGRGVFAGIKIHTGL